MTKDQGASRCVRCDAGLFRCDTKSGAGTGRPARTDWGASLHQLRISLDLNKKK